jgi:hypothetical protein
MAGDVDEKLQTTVLGAARWWLPVRDGIAWNADEVQRSIGHGFVHLWPVFEDYDIGRVTQDNALVGYIVLPRGKVVRVYPPIVHRELPEEFAKLYEGELKPVRRFARTYGLLGYGDLTEQSVQGDPLPWIWRHAETVRLCLTLTHLLQAGDVAELREKLHTLQLAENDRPPTLEAHWPMMRVAIRDTPEVWSWGEGNPATQAQRFAQEDTYVMHLARRMRNSLINANIARMYRWLPEQIADPERSSFGFCALIEVVYWLLADTVDHGHVKLCEACGAPFVQTKSHQRFCPPRLRRKDSACAVRQRVRKYLNKTTRQPEKRPLARLYPIDE